MAATADSGAPLFKLRIRVMQGESIALGPGKIDLLEALDRTRSISAAARELGMSYRRAWLLIDEINAALRQPAVASSIGGAHGGGSSLTATGHRLIALYRRVEAEALQASQRSRAELLQLLAG